MSSIWLKLCRICKLFLETFSKILEFAKEISRSNVQWQINKIIFKVTGLLKGTLQDLPYWLGCCTAELYWVGKTIISSLIQSKNYNLRSFDNQKIFHTSIKHLPSIKLNLIFTFCIFFIHIIELQEFELWFKLQNYGSYYRLRLRFRSFN